MKPKKHKTEGIALLSMYAGDDDDDEMEEEEEEEEEEAESQQGGASAERRSGSGRGAEGGRPGDDGAAERGERATRSGEAAERSREARGGALGIFGYGHDAGDDEVSRGSDGYGWLRRLKCRPGNARCYTRWANTLLERMR
ncbi:unnamed protein product [Closterium sp. NIES-54]